MRLSYRLTALVSPLLLLFPTPSLAKWFSDTQSAMGTEIRVELWLDDKARARQAIDKVMGEMRRVDVAFSPYKSGSELSKLNRWAADDQKHANPRKISTELFSLLSTAQEISTLSSGAFDISFASVGNFYNFRAGKKPTTKQLARTLPAINYQHIQLDDKKRTVRFKRKGVRINLGGIAKGHAVDRAIKILQSNGVEHAMVAAGGDSRILGDRRGRPWLTGIKDPRAEPELDKSAESNPQEPQSAEGMAVLIPLQDTAVSTSGDYERFFIEDGKRYHHIINPRTGDSARKVRSVTVLGKDALTTDALSTTVFVLGVKKGLALVNRLPGIDAIIIDGDGKLHYSAELQRPQ